MRILLNTILSVSSFHTYYFPCTLGFNTRLIPCLFATALLLISKYHAYIQVLASCGRSLWEGVTAFVFVVLYTYKAITYLLLYYLPTYLIYLCKRMQACVSRQDRAFKSLYCCKQSLFQKTDWGHLTGPVRRLIIVPNTF